jgi:hypothetical protein
MSLFMARNVVCHETALRLELGTEPKCPACVRKDAVDPKLPGSTSFDYFVSNR